MKVNEYSGYEVGPIRPPSESNSLLLRLTRNCPWNKCRFCTLYKNKKFSIRSVEHVIKDIEMIRQTIDQYKKSFENGLSKNQNSKHYDKYLEYIAIPWFNNGMRNVFLQDANSMLYKPEDLIKILYALRNHFPSIERITTYARSHTVDRINQELLNGMKKAGLNRIHIGMESGCDEILKKIEKGVDKAIHISAGIKVKNAGIELSEYFMPGLGGNEFSELNALETADAMNQINPDFIRIRTLTLQKTSLLQKDYNAGLFTRTSDKRVIEEILLFICKLTNINSYITSDHVINLLPEINGKLPGDKAKMIQTLEWFLALPDDEQMLYTVGRRILTINSRMQFLDPIRRKRTKNIIKEYKISKDNFDIVMNQIMERYI